MFSPLFIATIQETPGFYCPGLLIGPGLQWVGPAPGWVGGVATALEDGYVPFLTSHRATFPEPSAHTFVDQPELVKDGLFHSWKFTPRERCH